jgi:hypothetical protein
VVGRIYISIGDCNTPVVKDANCNQIAHLMVAGVLPVMRNVYSLHYVVLVWSSSPLSTALGQSEVLRDRRGCGEVMSVAERGAGGEGSSRAGGRREELRSYGSAGIEQRLVEIGRSIQGRFVIEELGRAVRVVVAKQGLQINALLKYKCTTACKMYVAQLLASQRGGRAMSYATHAVVQQWAHHSQVKCLATEFRRLAVVTVSWVVPESST